MSFNATFLGLAGLVEASAWEPRFEIPATAFLQFPALAAELRSKIIDHYLIDEVQEGNIAKVLHHDNFGSACCVWNWPEELIICDRDTTQDLPHTMFPRWLPNLALTNHQMRGEVIVHMLQTTNKVTLKYDRNKQIKIASWIAEFLATFPEKEGFEAIKNLNFPHIHWYNSLGPTTALTNPDIDLIQQCGKIQRVGFTFHAFCVTVAGPHGVHAPLPLSTFLDHFKLRPMLNCKNLKQIYIGGIFHRNLFVQGGDQLKTLRDFRKWLREEFKKQDQGVTVTLFPRSGAFSGWHDGQTL